MRTRVRQFKDMKQRRERITAVTAYDYTMARLADKVGIPLLLVGDSLGNVVLGYKTTVRVTMDECCITQRLSSEAPRTLWL